MFFALRNRSASQEIICTLTICYQGGLSGLGWDFLRVSPFDFSCSHSQSNRIHSKRSTVPLNAIASAPSVLLVTRWIFLADPSNRCDDRLPIVKQFRGSCKNQPTLMSKLFFPGQKCGIRESTKCDLTWRNWDCHQ